MRWSKKVTAVVAVGSLAIGGAVAFAAWTVSGTGSGKAKAATATALTITAPATVTGDLYPGAVGDLTFVVANPNSFPVMITGVSPGAAITSDQTGCDDTDVTFAAVTGLTIAVPANAPAQSVVLDNAVSMVVDAANECQGATFTVPIAVTAASNA